MDAPSERGDWASVELRLGTPLPEDYRSLVNAMGAARVGDFLTVSSPFTTNPHIELRYQAALAAWSLEVLEEHFFEVVPDRATLLAWGVTDNGDLCYWRQEGAPSEWWVTVNESRGPTWTDFPMGVGAFLDGLLSLQIRCEIFPDDFPEPGAVVASNFD
jgi:hypothetical protein